MAEAIFQLSAEIVPVVNDRELQRRAEALSKQFNQALAKDIKPIQVAASDKALAQVVSTVKQTGTEVDKTTKKTVLLEKAFKDVTDVLNKGLEKTKQAGDQAATALGTISKKLQEASAVGLKKLTEQIRQLPAKTASVARSIGTSFENAFQAGRRGLISFFDAVNVTNTKLISFSGNIREAIKENKLFKSALQATSNAVGVISTLPDRFKTLQAQVLSGTSALQKNAQAGDGFSQAILPLVLLTTVISKEIATLSENTRQLAFTLSQAGRSATDFSGRLFAFKSNAEGTTRSIATGFQQIGAAAKGNDAAVRAIQETFDRLSPRGSAALIKGFSQLRPVLKELEIQAARTGVPFANFDRIIRQVLFAIDPSQLSRFDILRTKLELFIQRFTDFGDRVRAASQKSSEGIRDLQVRLGDFSTRLTSFATNRGVPALQTLGTTVGGGILTLAQRLRQADLAITDFGSQVARAGDIALRSFPTYVRLSNAVDSVKDRFSTAVTSVSFFARGVADITLQRVTEQATRLGQAIGRTPQGLATFFTQAAEGARLVGGLLSENLGVPGFIERIRAAREEAARLREELRSKLPDVSGPLTRLFETITTRITQLSGTLAGFATRGVGQVTGFFRQAAEGAQFFGGELNNFARQLGIFSFFDRVREAVSTFNRELGVSDKAKSFFDGIANSASAAADRLSGTASRIAASIVKATEIFPSPKDSTIVTRTAAAEKQLEQVQKISDDAQARASERRAKAETELAKARQLQAQVNLGIADVTQSAANAQRRIAEKEDAAASALERDALRKLDNAKIAQQKAALLIRELEENQRLAAGGGVSGAAAATGAAVVTPVPKLSGRGLEQEAVRVGTEVGIILKRETEKVVGGPATPGLITSTKNELVKEAVDAADAAGKAARKELETELSKPVKGAGASAIDDILPGRRGGRRRGISGKSVLDTAEDAIGATAAPRALKGIQAISGATGTLGGGLGGLTRTVIGAAGGLEGLGLAGLGAGAGLGALAIAALSASARVETLRTALTGIFGAQAESGFQQIADFAKRTPFTLETATNSVIKLGSALKGLSIPGGLAITEQIAGAAAAVGATDDAINRVTLAFTQIAAAGKLTADNIRQITEALPNVSRGAVFENLAESLGVSTEKAKELAEQGLIPASKGLQAFVQTFNEVPGATTALEKQSQTFAGLTSTVKDTGIQLLSTVGAPLLAVAKPTLQAIIFLLDFFKRGAEAVGILLGKLADIIGSRLAPSVDKVGNAIQGFIDKAKSVPGVTAAFEFLGQEILGVGKAGATAGAEIDNGLQEALDATDPLKRALQAVVLATDPKKIIDNFDLLKEAATEATSTLLKGDIEILEKTLSLESAFNAQSSAAKAVTAAQTRLTDAIAEHNKEIADKALDLEDKLTKARDKTAEATEKQADAQTKLDEALKGADPEELEKGELGLASAKLRLRQLIEDERKAQEELNKTQQVGIDLTGLSLDQVKSRLSTVRQTLSLQKQGAKTEEKSTEQKEIDAATATITRRNAELDIVDATKTVEELKAKGSEKDPEVIQARKDVRDATKETTDSKQKELDIQKELDELHGPDLKFQKEVAELQQGITDAKIAQRDAEEKTTLAIAKAKDDKEEIRRLELEQIERQPELKRILLESNIPLENAISLSKDIGTEFDIQKTKVGAAKSEVELLNEALQKTIEIGKQFGLDTTAVQLRRALVERTRGEEAVRPEIAKFVEQNFLSSGKFRQDVGNILGDFLKKAGEGTGELLAPKLKDQLNDVAVLAAAGAVKSGILDFEEVKKIVQEALRQIPGFNQVQLAQGALVNGPTQALIGEAGREVVLPLTRPARLADLLSNRQVLPPILAALQKITLPGIKAPTMDQVKLSPSALPELGLGNRSVRSTPQNNNAQDQAKRDKAFAKAIVAEMKEAGFASGGATVNNNFVSPDANDPLAKIKLKQIAREVKRQIEGL